MFALKNNLDTITSFHLICADRERVKLSPNFHNFTSVIKSSKCLAKFMSNFNDHSRESYIYIYIYIYIYNIEILF